MHATFRHYPRSLGGGGEHVATIGVYFGLVCSKRTGLGAKEAKTSSTGWKGNFLLIEQSIKNSFLIGSTYPLYASGTPFTAALADNLFDNCLDGA